MCGRYAIAQEKNELLRRYGINTLAEILPEINFNIRPTDQIPIVLESHKIRGERRLESARWSLVPSWAKQLELTFPTFNARVETAAEKPSFRASVRNRRCIIPATGYYEWLTEGKTKTPYFVTPGVETEDPNRPITPAHEILGDAAPLINFAGLYSWWKNPDVAENDSGHSPWVLSATILTRPSHGALAEIHDRVPMMVPDNLIEPWLDPRVEGTQGFLNDFSNSTLGVLKTLTYYEVGPVRGNDQSLIVAI